MDNIYLTRGGCPAIILEEAEICFDCRGSGEGMFDETICLMCGGSGELKVDEVE